MTSGVKWNEDYTDPKSDVAQFNLQAPVPGEDITVSYMKRLPREAPAGSKWVYKTGETNLIGVLVSSATGKTLSAYLSEKVWKPFGMEADGVWMLGPTGHERSEEHTSELQSLMRISYAVFCLKKKKTNTHTT